MEIYQDTIFDLFNSRSKVEMLSGGGGQAGGYLRFRGLREVPCQLRGHASDPSEHPVLGD
jgi:hypothetical protein